MKILKKIVLAILVVFVLALLCLYVYFDRKFTPEENYLTIENESGPIPFTWLGEEKNVLLLPLKFEGDSIIYHLQFDTGSPYTVLYSKSIKNIKTISIEKDRVKTSFYIGETKISSDKFKIINQGKVNGKKDTLHIIGTLGADILENRKNLIDFKQNNIVINLSKEPHVFKNKLMDFKFKKRKIILYGLLKGKEEKFLFDSGTSAYELLTNKEVWQNLKLPNSKITIEKSEQSWENVLTTYTAECNEIIEFKNVKIPLQHVTYVEGFSKAQYSMMKFSGMTGMLGNKIFLNSTLYIDCTENKIGIE